MKYTNSKKSYFIKLYIILLVVISLIAGILYLIYDNNKNFYENVNFEKDFLQTQLNRLPIPNKKVENEEYIKKGSFKGIMSYYCEPISQTEAENYNSWLQSESAWHLGEYFSLNDKYSGAIVGPHYYNSIIKKLGYGWFSYDGNLYAKYYNKDKAEDKPNYRNKYEFYFVKSQARYKIVLFCNQENPEKALSSTIDIISELYT